MSKGEKESTESKSESERERDRDREREIERYAIIRGREILLVQKFWCGDMPGVVQKYSLN